MSLLEISRIAFTSRHPFQIFQYQVSAFQIYKVIHGSPWDTVSLCKKLSRSILIFKSIVKISSPESLLYRFNSNFFINVVVNACFFVYIFSTFKSYISEGSGNSPFNKSFAFKLIFSFIGMEKVVISSFDINSKQRFKSLCDKQFELLLKRKSERKNIFKKVFTSKEKFDILIIEGTTFQ